MQLTVLVDNNTYIDKYYLGEPAVSYYIEDEGRRLLFDTGYSSVFMENAAAMGIDLKKIDTLVLSHGHDDHTGGLKSFLDVMKTRQIHIVAHPQVFDEKRVRDLSICSPVRREELLEISTMTLSRQPVKISPNITFLGEIPVSFPYEERRQIGERRLPCCHGKKEAGSSWAKDYVEDDSAVVCQGQEGLFIITGCSHSGICNIIEYAKKVCNEDRIYGVIGGFHLFEMDSRAEETIRYLEGLSMKKAYPCHCTSFAVRAAMSRVIPVEEVGVGMRLIW